jgi:hypothetical protein
MILAWIAIGIMCGVAVLVVLGLSRARPLFVPAWQVKAEHAACETNLANLATAIAEYRKNNGERFPPRLSDLCVGGFLRPSGCPEVFICPSVFDPRKLRNTEAVVKAIDSGVMEGAYVYVLGNAGGGIDSTSVVVLCDVCGKSDSSVLVLLANGEVVTVYGTEARRLSEEARGGKRPVLHTNGPAPVK